MRQKKSRRACRLGWETVARIIFLASCVYLFLAISMILVGWREEVEESLFVGNGPPVKKKFRIVGCAKVSLEEPYLVEWVLFHHLQGFDKLFLYVDVLRGDEESFMSSLRVQWLPALFSQAGLDGLVELAPESLLAPDIFPQLTELNETTVHLHRMLQNSVATHCVERYRHQAQWIAHLDVDEFIYSPSHATTWDFLQTLESKWFERWLFGPPATVYVPSTIYGSSGQTWDFRTGWTTDLNTGRTVLRFDPRDSVRYQMSIGAGRRKEPPRQFGAVLDEAEHWKLSRFRELANLAGGDGANFSTSAKYFTKRFATDFRNESLPAEPPAFVSGVTNVSALAEEWRLHFPLIVESQLRRIPSPHLDSKSFVTKMVRRFISSCKTSKAGICSGSLPPSAYTLAGKSLYRSASINQSAASKERKSALRGCKRVWTHGCANDLPFGSTYTPGAHDLRLDHHQFRSLERRTLKHREWRGGAYGMLQQKEFVGVQLLASAVFDDSKLNLAAQVRDALKKFDPVPKMLRYSFAAATGTVSLLPGEMQQCTALELLSSRQAQCPRDHPHVGFVPTTLAPSSSLLPYNWCSDVPMPGLQEGRLGRRLIDPDDTGTVMCPGYPHLSCCDFTPELERYAHGAQFPS